MFMLQTFLPSLVLLVFFTLRVYVFCEIALFVFLFVWCDFEIVAAFNVYYHFCLLSYYLSFPVVFYDVTFRFLRFVAFLLVHRFHF